MPTLTDEPQAIPGMVPDSLQVTFQVEEDEVNLDGRFMERIPRRLGYEAQCLTTACPDLHTTYTIDFVGTLGAIRGFTLYQWDNVPLRCVFMVHSTKFREDSQTWQVELSSTGKPERRD